MSWLYHTNQYSNSQVCECLDSFIYITSFIAGLGIHPTQPNCKLIPKGRTIRYPGEGLGILVWGEFFFS